MRVWDVNPGYLNRQSLFGEHGEIHAILSIITHHKKGYARHPETLRWKTKLGALKHRHDLVVSEMQLRGYQHHSPAITQGPPSWPSEFIDPPGKQFAILRNKYSNREPGRIPLPQTTQQLWAQHKYSVLARDVDRYRKIGRLLAQPGNDVSFEQLALDLVEMLRDCPPEGRLMNALYHMWGYVSQFVQPTRPDIQSNPTALITAIRELSFKHGVNYLLESTALSDLRAWVSAVEEHGGGSSCPSK